MTPTEYLAAMRAMMHTLTALIHGVSGAGKSWLGATAPKPLLVLDAEGRARYAPSGRKVYWNPTDGTVVRGDGTSVTQVVAGGPPAYDGTWDTCIVQVWDYATVATVYSWLRSGQHHFIAVVMDSLMEVQRRCKAAIKPGTSALERDDWGVLGREIEKKVCDFRDLVLVPQCGIRVVLFITGSHSETYKPRLDGAMRENIAYYLDVVGYLFKQIDAQGQFNRFLLVDEQPPFTAKDGTNRLKAHFGPIIPLPEDGTQFIEQWYTTLLANGSAATPQEGIAAL